MDWGPPVIPYQTPLMKPLLFVLLFGVPLQPGVNPYATIGAIPPPMGFRRVTEDPRSFGSWLRAVPLKKSLIVHLYNGAPKENQDAQFAVLDVTVGHEDLQQCADAVMRLRAEYLFKNRRYPEIVFYTERGVRHSTGISGKSLHIAARGRWQDSWSGVRWMRSSRGMC